MNAFSVVCSVLGWIAALFFLANALVDSSAPRQAASAALAVVFVVLPYTWLRMSQLLRQEKRDKEILAALEAINRKTNA